MKTNIKVPDLGKLAEIQHTDDFNQAIKKQRQEKSVKFKTSAFSIGENHKAHINAVAAQMSKKAGKPVNASAALRAILDRDMRLERGL